MRVVLTSTFIVAWLVTMAAGFTLLRIEGAALTQPSQATSDFSRPLHIKGVIRYVTPDQERWDDIAYWSFFGGIALALIAGAGMKRADRRQKK